MLLHTNRRFNIGDMKFKIQIGLSWLKAELHHIYIIHQYIDKSYKSWSKSSTWVYSRFLVWSVLLIEHLGSPPGFGGVRVAHRAPGFTPGFLVGSVLLIFFTFLCSVVLFILVFVLQWTKTCSVNYILLSWYISLLNILLIYLFTIEFLI